jgi:hypothetical protein
MDLDHHKIQAFETSHQGVTMDSFDLDETTVLSVRAIHPSIHPSMLPNLTIMYLNIPIHTHTHTSRRDADDGRARAFQK